MYGEYVGHMLKNVENLRRDLRFEREKFSKPISC